jgi:acyl-CoA synthetase (AMP-forming)/AMP-acid ligase II
MATTLSSMINARGPYQTKDKTLLFQPLFHMAGFCWFLVYLRTGVPMVMLTPLSPTAAATSSSPPALFNPLRLLEALEQHGVTVLVAVPPIMNLLAQHPAVFTHADSSAGKKKESNQFDLRSMRDITCGGAPLALEVLQAVEERWRGRLEIVQGAICSPLSRCFDYKTFN